MDARIDALQATFSPSDTPPSGLRGTAAVTADLTATNAKIAAAQTAITTARLTVDDPTGFFRRFLESERDKITTHLAVVGLAASVLLAYRQEYAFELADRLFIRAKHGLVELDDEFVYWYKTQAMTEASRLFTLVGNNTITDAAGWATELNTAKTNLTTAAAGTAPTTQTNANARVTAIANFISSIDNKRRVALNVLNNAPTHNALVNRLTTFEKDWGILAAATFATATIQVTAWANKARQDVTEIMQKIGSAQSGNSATMLWWQYRAATIVRALVKQLQAARSNPVTTAQQTAWLAAITAWRTLLVDPSGTRGWLQMGYQADASETVGQLTSTLATLQADILALNSNGGDDDDGSGTSNTGGGTTTTTQCDSELAKIRAKEAADAITNDRHRAFEQSAAQRKEAERSVWRMLAFGGVALFLCALGAFLFGILAFWAALAVIVTIGFGYGALERYQTIRDRDPGVFSQVNPGKLDPVPKKQPVSASSFTSGSGGGGGVEGGKMVRAFSSGDEGLRSTTARTSGAALAQEADAKRRRVTRPAVMAAARRMSPPPVAGFRVASADACGCTAVATAVGNTRKTWIGDGW
jgi:hypothetical protein